MPDVPDTPIEAMQSLGRPTPEITREVYLHAAPEEQRRAAESVERLGVGPHWTQIGPRRKRHQRQ
jgi:hypothetical protein